MALLMTDGPFRDSEDPHESTGQWTPCVCVLFNGEIFSLLVIIAIVVICV